MGRRSHRYLGKRHWGCDSRVQSEAVPYEVTFRKNVVVSDNSIYINECCWGGDIIRDELLPVISSRFEVVQTEQEDWGLVYLVSAWDSEVGGGHLL